jgi:cytochrome c-type biogenesis protein CcmH/NrfG
MRMAEASLRLNKNLPEGWRALGESYRVMGRTEEAEKAFRRAESLNAGR